MPRRLRLEFSGACYHVTNRGNYQRPIFASGGAAHSFQSEALPVARAELWEDQLRSLARAFGIELARLPGKKSAEEKLQLAAAMKCTTSVSRTWLAQRLQMGAASSLGPLLHNYRASGALDRPELKSILSRFLA